ncbi:cytochrome c [Pseudoxanthomonas sp. UTMC 1351]|uniref:cytochrome c n=1 Tax=Pseudoxanthomonas sp. UTMC 1351 TaxID=2695853 RepID=UPI0034CD72C4
MSSTKRKPLLVLFTLVVVVLAAAGIVWSGAYNVGADAPHTRPVYAFFGTVRDRSIQTRAASIQVPDLSDRARVVQGSGNYQAMCAGCHLAPGMTETELSQGLYPAPPDLTKMATSPAEAFWVIKHGIKLSGMPAWGKSMQDEYIWNLAAFLQELPKLDPEQYKAMVAQSGGHSHGGGESMPDPKGMNGDADHHGGEKPAPHPHTDSSPHSHEEAKAESGSPEERKDTSSVPHDGHEDDGHQH